MSPEKATPPAVAAGGRPRIQRAGGALASTLPQSADTAAGNVSRPDGRAVVNIPDNVPPLPMPDDPRWRDYLAGYERGVQSGYARGYADGVNVLREASAYLRDHVLDPESPTFAELERRRAWKPDVDTRTGPQLVADAFESWGIPRDDHEEAAS